MISLSELCQEAHEYAISAGFWEEPINLGEKVALIHSEASELLEELRKGDKNQWAIREELADICIRVFDMVGYFDFDLEAAISEKMAVNRERPHKHGKMF